MKKAAYEFDRDIVRAAVNAVRSSHKHLFVSCVCMTISYLLHSILVRLKVRRSSNTSRIVLNQE